MRGRFVWFAAGSAAGLYATTKARRLAYRLSTPGVVDQAAALGVGWRAFSTEVRHGMGTREQDVARRLHEATAALAGKARADSALVDSALADTTPPHDVRPTDTTHSNEGHH